MRAIRVDGVTVIALLGFAFFSGYQFRSAQEHLSTIVVNEKVASNSEPVLSISRFVKDDSPVISTPTRPFIKRKKPLVVHPTYEGPLQRVFPIYPHKLPCLPKAHNYGYGFEKGIGWDKKGMFYTKLSKCSSSTLAGIAVQIARNEAVRQNRTGDKAPQECRVKADHGNYFSIMHRDKAQSILWTFVREPASRQVSDFFHFHVSRRGEAATDSNLQTAARKALNVANYMTGGHFMRPGGKHLKTTEEKVGFIVDTYDFIGVVERFHESLIVLKMIFRLDLRDILYTSAKRSGGYDDGEYRETCHYIKRSVVSPTVKEWFTNSTEWNEYAKEDILLYRVALKSLDLTIESLGKAQVERQVLLLEEALKYTDDVCGPTAVYPCSAEGKKQSHTTCVDHDWACAHKCIETLDLS
jgi:hypothetical protein